MGSRMKWLFKSIPAFRFEREKSYEYIKIFALILETNEGTEITFWRVGLFLFDALLDNARSLAWRPQTLKLT